MSVIKSEEEQVMHWQWWPVPVRLFLSVWLTCNVEYCSSLWHYCNLMHAQIVFFVHVRLPSRMHVQ